MMLLIHVSSFYALVYIKSKIILLHKVEDNTPSENGLFHNRIFEKSKFVLQFTYTFCFE